MGYDEAIYSIEFQQWIVNRVWITTWMSKAARIKTNLKKHTCILQCPIPMMWCFTLIALVIFRNRSDNDILTTTRAAQNGGLRGLVRSRLILQVGVRQWNLVPAWFMWIYLAVQVCFLEKEIIKMSDNRTYTNMTSYFSTWITTDQILH